MLTFPHDISRLLTPGHPNWPGDAPFRVSPGARIAAGDSVNTGELCTSTHTGTHVDAPWHYDDAGARLQDVPLDVYVGRCRVLGVTAQDGAVQADVLAGLPETLAPRLLLRTGQPAHWAAFPEDFPALAPAFVREAAALIAGTNDLAASLRLPPASGRAQMAMARPITSGCTGDSSRGNW